MTPGDTPALAIQASRALAAAGQGDMVWGHVAVRDPQGRGIWIKAPGWGLEEVDGDRLQLVSWDAEVLLGKGTPHKECHIHLEILKASPDLTCTVHTHAVSAVAFGALGTALRPISHDGSLFEGEDVPRFQATGSLVSTPELGKALAADLGGAPAALMPKHGLVAAGRTVPAAVMHAVLLERACAVQLTAAAAGEVRVWSGDAEASAKHAECWADSQLEAGYRYLARRAATRAAARPLTPSAIELTLQ